MAHSLRNKTGFFSPGSRYGTIDTRSRSADFIVKVLLSASCLSARRNHGFSEIARCLEWERVPDLPLNARAPLRLLADAFFQSNAVHVGRGSQDEHFLMTIPRSLPFKPGSQDTRKYYVTRAPSPRRAPFRPDLRSPNRSKVKLCLAWSATLASGPEELWQWLSLWDFPLCG